MACNPCNDCSECLEDCICAPVQCTDGCIDDTKVKCVLSDETITICDVEYPIDTNLNVLLTALSDCTLGGGAADVFAKVSENDTETNYLEEKIIGTDCIDVTLIDPSGTEQLEISPILDGVSGGGDNLLQCTADGLYVPDTSLINVTGDVPGCGKEFLDEKLEAPIGDLVGVVGYGGYTNSVVVPEVGGGPTFTLLSIDVNLGAGVVNYSNTTVVSQGCTNLLSEINKVLTNNAALVGLNAYLISSSNAAGDDTCTIGVSGSGITYFKLYLNRTDTGAYDSIFGADATIMDPLYFSNVYYKIEDDAGCKTVSLHTYNDPEDPAIEIPICSPVDAGNVTLLGYNITGSDFPTLSIDINEPYEAGIEYIIDIKQDDGGSTNLLTGYVIKHEAGEETDVFRSIIPLPNHDQCSDLEVTITKDCGCCSTAYSTSITKTKTPIIVDKWQDVPRAAMHKDWVPEDGVSGWHATPLQYKLEGRNLYFRGGMVRGNNDALGWGTGTPDGGLPAGGDIPLVQSGFDELYGDPLQDEAILDINLIDVTSCISSLIGAEESVLGVHDAPYAEWKTVDDHPQQAVVYPTLHRESSIISIRNTYYHPANWDQAPNNHTLLNQYSRASLSNVVIRG